MLSHDRLKSLLHYDPETGAWTWCVRRGPVGPGSKAGAIRPDGYIQISINGKLYIASRLAWFYMNGVWPENEIDHRDRDKANNRWENLREANRSQNVANCGLRSDNTTGFKGVRFDPRKKSPYQVRIHVNGAQKHVGYFGTLVEAAAAYEAAAIREFGQFAAPTRVA